MKRIIPLAVLLLNSHAARSAESTAPAANADVQKINETFKGRGVMRDDTPPTPAQEALKK